MTELFIPAVQVKVGQGGSRQLAHNVGPRSAAAASTTTVVGRLRTKNRLTERVRRKTDDRLPAERRSGSSAIVAGNCRRQPLCRTKDILCAELYFTINRQGERLITTMDSDSDEPLSNLASMDYLRREIAKLEKLVVEKTTRVQPSATSPAAAGRRLLPRIPTADIADSPAAATPSSSVGPRGLRSPDWRLLSSRGEASGVPPIDAP